MQTPSISSLGYPVFFSLMNGTSLQNPHSQVTDKKTIADLLNDPAVLTGIMVCSILLWAVFAAVLYNVSHLLRKLLFCNNRYVKATMLMKIKLQRG